MKNLIVPPGHSRTGFCMACGAPGCMAIYYEDDNDETYKIPNLDYGNIPLGIKKEKCTCETSNPLSVLFCPIHKLK